MRSTDLKQPDDLRDAFKSYLTESFRGFDVKRIDHALETAQVSEGNEKMSPQCRVVITIPALHTERNLSRTLSQYLTQLSTEPAQSGFEIIILVNGPQKLDGGKFDLTDSVAYKEVLAFMNKFPKLRITLAVANYPEGSQRIGLIRKDLGALTIQRALDSDGVDLSNLVMVTNDADLHGLSDGYVDSIADAFGADAKLAAMTGFVDYPYEDFYSDHLFLTVQRFVDMLEIMRRHKLDKMTLRGGNTMIRLSDYIAAGGHNRSRKSENLPIYKHILRNKGPEAVAFDRHRTRITTSSRRQIAAINQGTPLVDRYQTFGKEGDLAEKYQVPRDQLRLSEVVHKVTAPNFKELLRQEIQSVYDRSLSHSEDIADVDDGGAVLGAKKRSQEFMRRAAFYLGFELTFKNDLVEIGSIEKLKELVLRKYDHN